MQKRRDVIKKEEWDIFEKEKKLGNDNNNNNKSFMKNNINIFQTFKRQYYIEFFNKYY